jgi:hypothetical protein
MGASGVRCLHLPGYDVRTCAEGNAVDLTPRTPAGQSICSRICPTTRASSMLAMIFALPHGTGSSSPGTSSPPCPDPSPHRSIPRPVRCQRPPATSGRDPARLPFATRPDIALPLPTSRLPEPNPTPSYQPDVPPPAQRTGPRSRLPLQPAKCACLRVSSHIPLPYAPFHEHSLTDTASTTSRSRPARSPTCTSCTRPIACLFLRLALLAYYLPG